MHAHLIRLIASSGVGLAAALLCPLAAAEDVKMVGVVTQIKLATDGKSAAATLKDSKSGQAVTLNISDDLTLDKFKDKRIQEGDEIRAKYDDAGGKNESKSFKKTAGC